MVEAAEPAPVSSEFIDPDALIEKLRELVVRRKLPTNVPQGLCYVTPDVTYLVWPRAFAILREAMGIDPNPFEDKRPYYVALSSMPSVLREEKGNIVSSIRFRPDSKGVCRVVRFDTESLFPDKKVLEGIGFYPDADKIRAALPDERVERKGAPTA